MVHQCLEPKIGISKDVHTDTKVLRHSSANSWRMKRFVMEKLLYECLFQTLIGLNLLQCALAQHNKLSAQV